MIKSCSKCKLDKPFDEFFKNKGNSTGYQSCCKPCAREQNRANCARWRAKNMDRVRELNSEWYSRNRDKQKEKFAEYYQDNKEHLRLKGRQHYEDNKAIYLHYSRKRKADIKQAVPPWLTPEMNSQILAMYTDSKSRSESEGVNYHVDHIVPLQGKLVCGLHVPWNLQVIPAIDNLRKHNKFESE